MSIQPSAYAQVSPVANPDLPVGCGLEIILVLDESGSLNDDVARVRSSVRGLLDALADTGSSVALVEFNLDARTPLGPDYLPVTKGNGGSLAPGGAFDLYLENNYVPNGFTNWDAAFVKVAEINQNRTVAPLVIFFTDSEPTVYTNRYGSIVGGDTNQTVDEAVESANIVKEQGSHIFVVGVDTFSAESRLIAISGPDRFPDQQTDFAQSDYTLTDFDQLATALRQIAFSLCGPSVTVTKYADSGSGLQTVSGQSFRGSVSITSAGQPATGFVWTEPVSGAASAVGTSQNATTGANGTAQWQWTPGTLQSPQPWSSQFVLDEVSLPGYAFSTASCLRKTLNPTGGFTTTPFTLTTLPATFAVGPNDLITCDVINERLALAVQKIANPTTVPEAGGDVTFTFRATNHGSAAVALTALNDSRFGNLHGQGSCIADGSKSLAVGERYQCTVVKRIAGDVGSPHTNTVTATVRAANGSTISNSASATVTFRDSQPSVTIVRNVTPPSRPEPGGSFTYTLQISNNSAGESLQLTTLNDTPFGNLTTVGGAITATTCTLPQTLSRAGNAGATYSCQFSATVTGQPGIYSDTLIAVLMDNDGNVVPFSRDQNVTITNLLPAASIQWAAEPQRLPEPGGYITFTATITNDSPLEVLTLSTLSNTLANLATPAEMSTTCQLPQQLAVGAAYRCTYRALIQQNSGTYPVALTATLTDDEQSALTLAANTDIEITNLPSSILVTKEASQTTITEPGGDVTFTVTVKNSSAVDMVTIDQVVDNIYGDLASSCTPALPATLAPAATLHCRFVGTISGAVGTVHLNEATASGIDDDGYPVSDSDIESVEITDVPSRLQVTQIAQPANLPEPGGPVLITTMIKNISPTDDVTIGKVETNEVELSLLPSARAANAALLDISATCQPALPATLAPGQALYCTFTKVVVGEIHQRHTSNVVVSGMDDESLPLEQTSREAIDIIDVPSSIRVTMSSNPVSVPEAGAPVSFTVRVRNSSTVDTVTITQLTNSQFGDLSARCASMLPATLLPGATIDCTFSEFISGDVDALLQQETLASAIDDDGQPVADRTQSTIGVTDTPSSLKMTQTAEPSGVNEPGALVTFTIMILNDSPIDTVTVNRVEDSLRGDISSSCQPSLPTTLAPGVQMNCQFSEFIGGNAATLSQRQLTVNGIDDDAVAVSDFNLIAVDVLDVLPTASLAATATPNQILETGEMVSMTMTIVNQGPEIATMTTLSSTLVGDLNGLGSCAVPQALAANGGTYRCTFNHFVDGVATAPPSNLVSALLNDDEGNEIILNDEADLFLLAVEPNLQLSKVDNLLVDLFENPADEGKVSPGDTLRYTINVGNTGNGTAEQILLEDSPDPNSALVVGSVTTSKGTILLGNTPGDQQLIVLIGDLAIGETVTIEFDVLILAGTGTTLLRNQAFLSYGTFTGPGGTNVEGSDDPNTPFLGDPTDTRVFIPPTNLDPEDEPIPLTQSLYLPMVQR